MEPEREASDGDEVERMFSALRTNEFSRLDAAKLTYLDHAGGALYPESLVRSPLGESWDRAEGTPCRV